MQSAKEGSLKNHSGNANSHWMVRSVLLVTLGLMSFGSVFISAQLASAKSPAEARLDKMFSREIQTVLSACEQRGGVNLASGADRDGSVVCGDGWRKSPVKYADYFDTVTDFLGAALLLGVRGGIQQRSDVKPEVLHQLLSNPEWIKFMRENLDQTVVESRAVPKTSPKSIKMLSDRVMERILPIMRDPTKLSGLTGTAEEYSTISQNFCVSAGLSIKNAKSLTPTLKGIQIYAICMQEAGVLDEFMAETRKPKSH